MGTTPIILQATRVDRVAEHMKYARVVNTYALTSLKIPSICVKGLRDGITAQYVYEIKDGWVGRRRFVYMPSPLGLNDYFLIDHDGNVIFISNGSETYLSCINPDGVSAKYYALNHYTFEEVSEDDS